MPQNIKKDNPLNCEYNENRQLESAVIKKNCIELTVMIHEELIYSFLV